MNFKTFIAISFLLAPICSVALNANPEEAVDVLVTWNQSAPISNSPLFKLDPRIEIIRTVFSESEREFLNRSTMPNLSRAIIARIKNERDYLDIKAKIEKENPEIHIEKNNLPISVTGLDSQSISSFKDFFGHKQWALNNTGQIVKRSIDYLSSRKLVGHLGEDIGVFRAPPENMSPHRTKVIAVLDSGVDVDHPDLSKNILVKKAECEALEKYTKCLKDTSSSDSKESCNTQYGSVDSDHNGYPLDCVGWNFTSNKKFAEGTTWGDPETIDQEGHGTHVSGIIAATADRDGVRGVLQNVRILPVKVITAAPSDPAKPHSAMSNVTMESRKSLDPRDSSHLGGGFGDIIARGLLYAIRSHVDVINMSLGWPKYIPSKLVEDMIHLAQSQNILVVSAAGNDATDTVVLPCSVDGVICVGSHSVTGEYSDFSNYGSSVDILAPGEGILSTFPRHLRPIQFDEAVGYEIRSGTSMASPYVAAGLAYLLNQGYSPDESVARLLSGARATPSTQGDPSHKYFLYTQSGNMDLAGAASARPRPYFMPLHKNAIALAWNNKSGSPLPFTFNLKNYWQAADHVSLEASLIDPTSMRPISEKDAILSLPIQFVENWPQGKEENLSYSIDILSDRLPSDLTLKLKVTSKDFSGNSWLQTLFIDLRVFLPISEKSEIEGLESFALPESISSLDYLRSVTAEDGLTEDDFVSIRKTENKQVVTLYREKRDTNQYVISGQYEGAPTNGDLFLIQRLDVNLDKQSDYVFIYRLKPSNRNRMPKFQFQFFDSQLKPLEVELGGQKGSFIEFDNKKSVITENFQWIQLQGQMVPAWIYRGYRPELDALEFDPWNPDPIESLDVKLYYLAKDGLRMIPPPQGLRYLSQLSPSPRQKSQGVMPILLASGKDTETRYFTSTLEGHQLAQTAPLNLPQYRMLNGQSKEPIINLNSRVEDQINLSATGFNTDSYLGAIRATGILLNSLTGEHETLDFVVHPPTQQDSVTNIISIFTGSRRNGLFAHNIYNYQYIDLDSGLTSTLSQRRYSFLPNFFSLRSTLPIVVGDKYGITSNHLPALYIADGFGLNSGIEVILPKYGPDNKSVILFRPATLQLQPQNGCQSLGNPIPPKSHQPHQLLFICRDHILKFPLYF